MRRADQSIKQKRPDICRRQLAKQKDRRAKFPPNIKLTECKYNVITLVSDFKVFPNYRCCGLPAYFGTTFLNAT